MDFYLLTFLFSDIIEDILKITPGQQVHLPMEELRLLVWAYWGVLDHHKDNLWATLNCNDEGASMHSMKQIDKFCKHILDTFNQQLYTESDEEKVYSKLMYVLYVIAHPSVFKMICPRVAEVHSYMWWGLKAISHLNWPAEDAESHKGKAEKMYFKAVEVAVCLEITHHLYLNSHYRFAVFKRDILDDQQLACKELPDIIKCVEEAIVSKGKLCDQSQVALENLRGMVRSLYVSL